MNFSPDLDHLIRRIHVNLIHLFDHIKRQTAKGLYTGMIMLDLQKAFDTDVHEILCNKLKVMGVRSIKWFQSYLTD